MTTTPLQHILGNQLVHPLEVIAQIEGLPMTTIKNRVAAGTLFVPHRRMGDGQRSPLRFFAADLRRRYGSPAETGPEGGGPDLSGVGASSGHLDGDYWPEPTTRQILDRVIMGRECVGVEDIAQLEGVPASTITSRIKRGTLDLPRILVGGRTAFEVDVVHRYYGG